MMVRRLTLPRSSQRSIPSQRASGLTTFLPMRQQPWANVPDARRAVMRANKAKDTKPEVMVRRMLHAIGYRFRLHRRDLPGTPDIIFPGRRKIIQVYGCFWHQHGDCRRANVPGTRQEYWGPKLARNKERDRESQARLEALGWAVMIIWECEVTDLHAAAERARAFLDCPALPWPGSTT